MAAPLQAAGDAVLAALVGDWLRRDAGTHRDVVCLAVIAVLNAIIWYVASSPKPLRPKQSLKMSQSDYIQATKQRNHVNAVRANHVPNHVPNSAILTCAN
ncbi:MAG: hypothetical protein M3022_02510 [Actinomycetota bacterium]|nr:hypothetical protein [Actinomycetota bacterium]